MKNGECHYFEPNERILFVSIPAGSMQASLLMRRGMVGSCRNGKLFFWLTWRFWGNSKLFRRALLNNKTELEADKHGFLKRFRRTIELV